MIALGLLLLVAAAIVTLVGVLTNSKHSRLGVRDVAL